VIFRNYLKEKPMIVKVYGPGCAKCKKVEEVVRRVIAETGSAAAVEKVTDMQSIVSLGILSTPAITVDGSVKCSGRVPKPEEIAQWLGK
jgi:small redox-active disulfide protein 2